MAIVIRVVAVAVLVAGPFTDQPSELSGWDAERFQEIADRTSPAWAGEPVEYPPGSVAVFDLLAGADVVATNRAIVVFSALAELIGVVALKRFFGARAAKAFLILGLPLVPMGLLRLDMAVTALAIGAAAALLGRANQQTGSTGSGSMLFATLTVVGAAIKIWPALLLVGALGLRRRAAAALAIVLGGLVGLGWLATTGAGLEPLDQVLSLRGATGWHVESLPGALVSLFSDDEARLELNAFRIGAISDGLVLFGRILAVAVMVGLGAVSARGANESSSPTRRLALVMIGAVSALLVTAPLLSPQFLLWLTPWAALLLADRHSKSDSKSESQLTVGLVALAVTLTGVTLTAFGPANLTQAVPALLLTVRNLALAFLPVACLAQLRSELGEG